MSLEFKSVAQFAAFNPSRTRVNKAFLLATLAISSLTMGCSPSPVELGNKNFIDQIVMPNYDAIRIHECDDTIKTQDGKELLTCRLLLHGGYVNWTEYQCETTKGGICSSTGRQPALGSE